MGFFEGCPFKARTGASFGYPDSIPLAPVDSRVSEIERSRQPHNYAGRDRIRSVYTARVAGLMGQCER